MAEFLLELLSEEIPAGMQLQAARDLDARVVDRLEDAGLPAPSQAEWHCTPRRLVVCMDIERASPDKMIERRGPRVDAPEKARDGFLRGLGSVEFELGEIKDKKGRFLLTKFKEGGRPTPKILIEELPKILTQFPWPKSMRWGNGDDRWVRPLQSILCVFDGEVVPVRFAGITAGRSTRGHRFMAPEPIEVASFEEYKTKLHAAKVQLDSKERLRLIEQVARDLAKSKGLRLRHDPRLLDELKGLVEWPVPLLGRIGDEFMELPPEVLVTSMREHQKYLALETERGQLAPYFVTVANIEASDGGKAIVDGNERVLRARLWDAKFFWDLDRKIELEDRLAALAPMVFHEKLGSLQAKAERLEALAKEIARLLPNADVDLAAQAGRLAKADLVTGMVGEFPELQGIMGGYYARAEGLPEAVAEAISEHYRFGGEVLSGPVSCAVNLADKLDTLVGFFAVGIRPTGSKDPFALRRSALGIIRIVLENELKLSLMPLLEFAVRTYGDVLTHDNQGMMAKEVLDFLHERLEVQQRDAGTRHDVIRAVTRQSAGLGTDELVSLLARVSALQDLLSGENGRNLLAAFRRAANILRIESKKDEVDHTSDTDVEEGRLLEEEELALAAALEELAPRIDAAIKTENFVAAMQELASIRPAVDAFFNSVMVNVEDKSVRRNRLRLLARLCAEFGRIADFSLIED